MTSLPFVDSVTPAFGPPAGGTSVTISGVRFTGTTAVNFDGNPAASFTVVDDNTITAVTPAGTGFVIVEIVNADGSSEDLVVVDSSGNGLDGVYLPIAIPFSVDVYRKEYTAGLVTGNPALLATTSDPNQRIQFAFGQYLGFAQAPFGPDTDFSVAWWQSCSANFDGLLIRPWLWVGASSGGELSMQMGAGGAINFGNPSFGAQSWSAGPLTVPVDGAPHFFVVTFDFALQVAALYVDGSVVSWSTTGTLLNSASAEYNDFGDAPYLPPEVFDELATYRSVLSSGDVSSLYSAGLSGFSAWDTAALALSPSGLYHFDDENSGLFTYRNPKGWIVGSVGMSA